MNTEFRVITHFMQKFTTTQPNLKLKNLLTV
jgi:hypothetical protein